VPGWQHQSWRFPGRESDELHKTGRSIAGVSPAKGGGRRRDSTKSKKRALDYLARTPDFPPQAMFYGKLSSLNAQIMAIPTWTGSDTEGNT